MCLFVLGSVTGVGESLLAFFEVFAKKRFLACVASVVDLQVLQPRKTSSTSRLFAFEGSLTSMNSEVGHKFVFGIKWLVETTAIL